MRVALVYDRLNKWGGAERVLQAFHSLFPAADWYTSFWDPQTAPFSRDWPVQASFLNRWQFLRRHHEWVPFLMPFIFESFNFSAYDLVISISSEAAKGIITSPRTIHLNYCLTPTRYLYSHRAVYLKSRLTAWVAHYLRLWDQVAATRPDEMMAISDTVKKRIQKYYNRDSVVIYPPIDLAHFTASLARVPAKPILEPGYFLVVSRLVKYKNIDQIIAAFRRLPQARLVIVGEGSEARHLRLLSPTNVQLVGAVSEATLLRYYRDCQAFIQGNIEDFGLAMVEAQACGKCVLAYNGGGSREIVVPGRTGLLYDKQGSHTLYTLLRDFDPKRFDPAAAVANAARFDIHIWRKHIMERVNYYVSQS